MEKKGPRSAGSIKTFKQIYSLEKILKQMHLVAIDLIFKIKEHLEDFDVFPTSIKVYQKAYLYANDREKAQMSTEQVFKKTFKMVSYEDFKEDPNCLVEHIQAFYKEHKH